MQQDITNTQARREMSFWPSALLGAVVSVVAAFVPFSPVLGGGVAGYLHGGSRREGLRVGAVAGALAAIPVAMVATLAVAVLAAVVIFDGVATLAFLGAVLFGVVALAMVVVAGLGALGGYLGVYIREEYEGREAHRRGVADVEPAV